MKKRDETVMILNQKNLTENVDNIKCLYTTIECNTIDRRRLTMKYKRAVTDDDCKSMQYFLTTKIT